MQVSLSATVQPSQQVDWLCSPFAPQSPETPGFLGRGVVFYPEGLLCSSICHEHPHVPRVCTLLGSPRPDSATCEAHMFLSVSLTPHVPSSGTRGPFVPSALLHHFGALDRCVKTAQPMGWLTHSWGNKVLEVQVGPAGQESTHLHESRHPRARLTTEPGMVTPC